MGIRTRGLGIGINAKRRAADAAVRAEAKAVIDRWNEQLAAGGEMLWSPTTAPEQNISHGVRAWLCPPPDRCRVFERCGPHKKPFCLR